MSVPFYLHNLERDDAKNVADVLDSSFLTTGQIARKVESQISKYFSVPEAVLCNSWTNGALAILVALDVKPGDEVILPAMTFVACANIVELLGATPVLVDVDPETLLMDFDACRAALTDRTRVVMPVHLYGQMLDVAALKAMVKGVREDIVILEDCAHAFESRYRGERPGTHGDLAVFSFYATKNVTCGEGGAIVAHDGDLMAKVRSALLHGMSAGAADRFKSGFYRHWDVEKIGIKGNLPDLLAALLPQQIVSIDQVRERRQHLVDRYRAKLDQSLRFAQVRPEAVSAHHLFPVFVGGEHRDRVLHELNAAGIGTTVNYRSVHRLTYYQTKYAYDDAQLPQSSIWGDGVLSLPLYPRLSEEQQDEVIAKLNEVIAGLAA